MKAERVRYSDLSDDEKSQAIYVSPRVADEPTPVVPSVEQSCDDCGVKVWVDKNMLGKALRASKIICMPCALQEIKKQRDRT